MPKKPGPPQTLEGRFWSKVDKAGPVPTHLPHLGPCWLWTGHNKKGAWPYGAIRTKANGVWSYSVAHRVSWELHNGPIPSGLWALHRCDNPLCVRPDHLFLGTAKHNTADMKAKGRSKFGGGRGSRHNKPIGTRLDRTCLHCGAVFQVRPSEAYRKYCGLPCARSCHPGRRTKLSPSGLAKFRKSRGWV